MGTMVYSGLVCGAPQTLWGWLPSPGTTSVSQWDISPNINSREISFAHNLFLSCATILRWFIEHGSDTIVICEKFRNDCANGHYGRIRLSLRWALDGNATLQQSYWSPVVNRDVNINTWLRAIAIKIWTRPCKRNQRAADRPAVIPRSRVFIY